MISKILSIAATIVLIFAHLSFSYYYWPNAFLAIALIIGVWMKHYTMKRFLMFFLFLDTIIFTALAIIFGLRPAILNFSTCSDLSPPNLYLNLPCSILTVNTPDLVLYVCCALAGLSFIGLIATWFYSKYLYKAYLESSAAQKSSQQLLQDQMDPWGRSLAQNQIDTPTVIDLQTVDYVPIRPKEEVRNHYPNYVAYEKTDWNIDRANDQNTDRNSSFKAEVYQSQPFEFHQSSYADYEYGKPMKYTPNKRNSETPRSWSNLADNSYSITNNSAKESVLFTDGSFIPLKGEMIHHGVSPRISKASTNTALDRLKEQEQEKHELSASPDSSSSINEQERNVVVYRDDSFIPEAGDIIHQNELEILPKSSYIKQVQEGNTH